ncbi:F-box domain-containing protein [Mycena kentingensis (nom. inval.)]|nr:F-box domain-containing protein [Mycena kentingensis (nom. inval.)]
MRIRESAHRNAGSSDIARTNPIRVSTSAGRLAEQALPVELWNLILEELPNDTLLRAALVCRVFNALAICIYFARPSTPFTRSNDGKAVTLSAKVLRHLRIAFSGPLPEHISCSFAAGPVFRDLSVMLRVVSDSRARVGGVQLDFPDDVFVHSSKHSRQALLRTCCSIVSTVAQRNGEEVFFLRAGFFPGALLCRAADIADWRLDLGELNTGQRPTALLKRIWGSLRNKKIQKPAVTHSWPPKTSLRIFNGESVDVDPPWRLLSVDVMPFRDAGRSFSVVLFDRKAQYYMYIHTAHDVSARHWDVVLPHLDMPALKRVIIGTDELDPAAFGEFLLNHEGLEHICYIGTTRRVPTRAIVDPPIAHPGLAMIEGRVEMLPLLLEGLVLSPNLSKITTSLGMSGKTLAILNPLMRLIAQLPSKEVELHLSLCMRDVPAGFMDDEVTALARAATSICKVEVPYVHYEGVMPAFLSWLALLPALREVEILFMKWTFDRAFPSKPKARRLAVCEAFMEEARKALPNVSSVTDPDAHPDDDIDPGAALSKLLYPNRHELNDGGALERVLTENRDRGGSGPCIGALVPLPPMPRPANDKTSTDSDIWAEDPEMFALRNMPGFVEPPPPTELQRIEEEQEPEPEVSAPVPTSLRTHSETIVYESPPEMEMAIPFTYPAPIRTAAIRVKLDIEPERDGEEEMRDARDAAAEAVWLMQNVAPKTGCLCAYLKRRCFCVPNGLIVERKGLIHRVPPELVDMIFEFALADEWMLNPSLHCGPNSAWVLSRRMILSFGLVCRRWTPVAERFLYRDITIRRVEQLFCLRDTIAARPTLTKYVRSFSMQAYVPKELASETKGALSAIWPYCTNLKTISDIAPFQYAHRYTPPAFPSNITDLTIGEFETPEFVARLLKAHCAQLRSLSMAVEDSALHDEELNFPHLHTLHVLVGDVTPDQVQTFARKWRMPNLINLRLSATQSCGIEFVFEAYEHILGIHGTKLRYLELPNLFNHRVLLSEELREEQKVEDYAPVLRLCPNLEHVVLPNNHFFETMPQRGDISPIKPKPYLAGIKRVDVWDTDIYQGQADPWFGLPWPFSRGMFPDCPTSEFRYIDTALAAQLVGAFPLLVERAERGTWAVPGMVVSQVQRIVDGDLCLRMGDHQAALEWGKSYFGWMETHAVCRDQDPRPGGAEMEMAGTNTQGPIRREPWRDWAAWRNPDEDGDDERETWEGYWDLTAKQVRLQDKKWEDETDDENTEDMVTEWVEDLVDEFAERGPRAEDDE